MSLLGNLKPAPEPKMRNGPQVRLHYQPHCPWYHPHNSRSITTNHYNYTVHGIIFAIHAALLQTTTTTLSMVSSSQFTQHYYKPLQLHCPWYHPHNSRSITTNHYNHTVHGIIFAIHTALQTTTTTLSMVSSSQFTQHYYQPLQLHCPWYHPRNSRIITNHTVHGIILTIHAIP